MTRPDMSVLMPVYNAELYVAEAIESILNQTYRNFEFLIIDDGSTDGSLPILQRYAALDARIRLINRENRGIVHTLNEGIDMARAPYIARMDADDISYPQRFEKQYDFMETHPEYVAVGSAVTLIDPEGAVLRHMEKPLTHDEIDHEHMLSGTASMIAHPTALMRVHPVHTIGKYSDDYPYAEDLDLFIRLAEAGTLGNLREALLKYRVHGASIGYTQRETQLASIFAARSDAYTRRMAPVPPNAILCSRDTPALTCTNTQANIAASHRMWAWWALSEGNVGTARKHAWRALKKSMSSLESWRVCFCALRGR